MRFLPASEILANLPSRDIFTSLAQLAIRDNVSLYLVGGTVRDIILKRPIVDLDFAVSSNAMDFAYKFAELSDAVCVPLDEKHDISRLIFPNGYFYMDFSGIRGTDIITDLVARDFTINAMAIDASQILNNQDLEVIDPTNGTKDLNSRLIKPASSQSIIDDPIRMMRAYRFAASLGFIVHDTTLDLIRESLVLLDSVSMERIRDELFKILSVDNSIRYLREMDNVGLLERIFPEIIPMKGMEQNEYHHLDVWDHSLLTLEYFEENPVPDSLEDYKQELEGYLQYEPVIGRQRLSLLKLAALLHDIGKPHVRTMDKDGRIRFFNHNRKGAEIFLNIGSRLKLANREILFISKIIGDHMYPLGLSVFFRKPRTTKDKNRIIRRFIRKADSELLGILLLSYADLQATQGEWRKHDDLEKLSEAIENTADMYFQETAFQPRLINGNDIMEEFKIPASPIIGRLLKQVTDAQVNGKISTRDDAMEMVKNILSKE